MKKALRLAEVKALFGSELVFETRDCFLAKQFGKYLPNLVFVLSKEFSLDKDGKPVSPVKFVRDINVTDNLNLVFNGDPKIIFWGLLDFPQREQVLPPQEPFECKAPFNKGGLGWGRRDSRVSQ